MEGGGWRVEDEECFVADTFFGVFSGRVEGGDKEEKKK